jgi:uncharacterized coiled-coil protein SlyX
LHHLADSDAVECVADISSEVHVETIRKHYMYLLDAIDPKFSGLIGELYRSCVISRLEKEDLEVESSAIRRNELLLSLLSRKSHNDYELFLLALDLTSQQHVTKTLRGELDVQTTENNRLRYCSDAELSKLVISLTSKLADRDKTIDELRAKMQDLQIEMSLMKLQLKGMKNVHQI